jgi:hypothetical protein
MELLDYQSFLNEGKNTDAEFDAKDVIQTIQKLSKKIDVKDKRNSLEIWVYLDDRDSQSKTIDKELQNMGIEVEQVRMSISSYPISEFVLDGQTFRLVYKPVAGQAATTLHSTITELVPVLLLKAGYTGSPDPQTMIEACRSVNLDRVSWAGGTDMETAKKYLDMFEDAPLYTEKMGNAFGIYQWCKSQNPKDLVWCYRVKPGNVPANSRADLYLEPSQGAPYGVSVKAKSTASAKVRKTSSTFFEFCDYMNPKLLEDIKTWGWDTIYKGIVDEAIQKNPEDKNLAKINQSNYWNVGSKTAENKLLVAILDAKDKENSKSLDEIGYYKIQEKIRDGIAEEIRKSPDKFAAFLKLKMGISDKVFAVKVVEARGTNAYEVEDDSEESLSAILDERPIVSKIGPSLKRIEAYFGKHKFDFDIWNSEGGNKTASFYKFRIAQVG